MKYFERIFEAERRAGAEFGARALIAVQIGDYFYMNSGAGKQVEHVRVNPCCVANRVHMRAWDGYVIDALENDFGGMFDRLVVVDALEA